MRRALAFLSVALAASISPASAEPPCVDHSLYGIPRTTMDVVDIPDDLQLVGDLLYAATPNRGLRIFRESSPGTFDEVGGVSTPGSPTAVCVSGSFAYLAARSAGGLQIVDVSKPATPLLAGSATSQGAEAVAVTGSTAWVSRAGLNGVLRVFDVSDPSAPSIRNIWSSGLSGFARKILAEGNLLYLAIGSSLAIVDGTDPLVPQLLGVAPTGDLATDVTLDGSLAFVAAGEAGLRIVDVSNPVSPFEVGALVLPEDAGWVAVIGDVAVVTGSTAQAMAVDVSDPASPGYLGYAPVGLARDVVPLDPSRVAIGVSPNAGISGILATIDVSPFETTPFAGRLFAGGRIGRTAELQGDHLYGPVGGAGFEIWDVGDGPPATFVGAYPGYGYAEFSYSSIGTDGETAILTGAYDPGLGGPVFLLERVDVSDPVFPTWTRLRTTAQTPNDYAEVVDGTAWVVSDNTFLSGWDVRTDIAPIASAVSAGLFLRRFTIRDGLAYASGLGLEVFDVSPPEAVSSIASLQIAGGSKDVTLEGDLAYVATGPGGLTIVDVGDPTAPTILSSLDLSEDFGCSTPRGLHVQDSFVYLPCELGIQVVDATDPFAPVRVGELFTPEPSETQRVLPIDGGLLHLPSGWVAPVQCGAVATGSDVRPGLAMSLGPNPFREELAIRFSTPAPGPVRLDVVDVRGRLVRRVSSGAREAGSHAIRWDGRNGSGDRVAPGVYFLRLDAENGPAVRRAVHVR